MICTPSIPPRGRSPREVAAPPGQQPPAGRDILSPPGRESLNLTDEGLPQWPLLPGSDQGQGETTGGGGGILPGGDNFHFNRDICLPPSPYAKISTRGGLSLPQPALCTPWAHQPLPLPPPPLLSATSTKIH